MNESQVNLHSFGHSVNINIPVTYNHRSIMKACECRYEFSAMIQFCFTRGCNIGLISAHASIQMWMNVSTVLTGAIRMLAVQTVTAHIPVTVTSATVEMDSSVEVRLLNRKFTVLQLLEHNILIKICDVYDNVIR